MPNKRIQDLKGSASNLRVKIRRSGFAATTGDMAEELSTILAANAIDRARLSDIATVEGVEKTWKQYKQMYRSLLNQGFLNTMRRDVIRDLATRNDNGAALEESLCDYAAGLDTMPDDLTPHMYPSAGLRIVKLKERMARGDFRTPEEKRGCLAEMIAARELVGAGHSGIFTPHGNLYDVLGPGLKDKVQNVRERLNQLSDQQIDNLFRMGMLRGYGGQMQNEYNRLAKTPYEATTENLIASIEGIDSSNEAVRSAAAHRIWLEGIKELSPAEQARRLADAESQDEIETLRHSDRFRQLLQNVGSSELYNMTHDPDPGKLMAAMQAATKDIENSPYSALYDALKADPQRAQKLENDLNRLLEINRGRQQQLDQIRQQQAEREQELKTQQLQLQKELEEGKPGAQARLDELNQQIEKEKLQNKNRVLPKPIPASWSTKIETVRALIHGNLQNKYDFIDAMEKLHAYGAGATMTNGPSSFRSLADMAREEPALLGIEDQLLLAKPGTAGALAGNLMSGYFDGGKDGLKEIFMNMVALSEIVGDDPNWRDRVLTEQELKQYQQRCDALINDMYEAENEEAYAFGSMSMDEAAYMVRKGGPAACGKHFRDRTVQKEQEPVLQEEKASTVQGRIEQLFRFPGKEKIRALGDTFSKAEKIDLSHDVAAEILAARATARYTARHPDKVKTVEDVDRINEDYRKAYRSAIRYGDETEPEDAVMIDDDGAELEARFRKSMIGTYKRLPDEFLKLPAEDYPTAKDQIERIQRAVRQGELKPEFSGQYIHERKRAVAMTLAARELLGVQRGGEGLDRRLTPEVYNRASEIEKILNPMSEKDFGKLYGKLTSGHGGAMVEQYRKMNSYMHYIENQKNYREQRLTPAVAAANMLAAASIGRKEEKGVLGPIDIQRVDTLAERLSKEDAMKELMKDENAVKLVREGKVIELTRKFIEKRTELAAQKQAAPKHQPEANKELQNGQPENQIREQKKQDQINGPQPGFQRQN